MKILVTGNAGSGKSTVASTLAKKHELTFASLDSIVWQEGWKKTPRDVCKKEVEKLISHDSWVIDGVDYDVMAAAEFIVFLDLPRAICAFRAMRRNMPYLFSSRPELPDNCPEILILPHLLKIIWRFPKRVKPNILAEKAKRPEHFIHIRSSAELKTYIYMMQGI